MIVWPRIVFLVLVLRAIVALQVFLSKNRSKYPGLILPLIFFAISLIYPLNIAAPEDASTVSLLLMMLMVLLIANIPTMILLGIYMACRDKAGRRKELEKMKIRDLK